MAVAVDPERFSCQTEKVSSQKISDTRVFRTFPYPIARAWRALLLCDNDAARVAHLINTLEIIIRTLIAYTMPDYLRGEKNSDVEEVFLSLQKPQRGLYVLLLKEILRSIGKRKGPDPFIPEAVSWYWIGEGKISEFAKIIDAIVTYRNQLEHREAPATTSEEWRKRRNDLEEKLRIILTSLDWIRGYRMFRINKQTRLRTLKKQERHRLDVGFFVGHDARTPILETVQCEVGLPDYPQCLVFLTNPTATEFLELSPFVMFSVGDTIEDKVRGKKKKQTYTTNQETCLLFKSVDSERKKLLLQDDDTRSMRLSKVPSGDEEQDLFDWMNIRESLEFSYPNSYQENFAFAEEILPSNNFGLVRYNIKERIGKGATSTVYRASDSVSMEDVALKIMSSDLSHDPYFFKRFRREALIAHQIRHPNLVRVLDQNMLEDQRICLVLELKEGGSLQDLICAEGIPESRVSKWTVQLLSALSCIHERGIIHRDIKPANCLLDLDDNVYLADFGVARVDDSSLTTTLDRNLGNRRYASPEQLQGREINYRSDIFSLAKMLHELLEGELPHDSIEGSCGPGEGIPGSLGELLRRMGEFNPEDRPHATDAVQWAEANIVLSQPKQPDDHPNEIQSSSSDVGDAPDFFATTFNFHQKVSQFETTPNLFLLDELLQDSFLIKNGENRIVFSVINVIFCHKKEEVVVPAFMKIKKQFNDMFSIKEMASIISFLNRRYPQNNNIVQELASFCVEDQEFLAKNIHILSDERIQDALDHLEFVRIKMALGHFFLHQSGDTSKAIAQFQNALHSLRQANEPNTADLRTKVESCLALTQKIAQTMEKTKVEKNKNILFKQLIGLSDLWISASNTKKAIAVLQEAKSIRPMNIWILSRMRELLQLEQDTNGVQQIVDEMILLEPSKKRKAELHLELADLQKTKTGDVSTAMKNVLIAVGWWPSGFDYESIFSGLNPTAKDWYLLGMTWHESVKRNKLISRGEQLKILTSISQVCMKYVKDEDLGFDVNASIKKNQDGDLKSVNKKYPPPPEDNAQKKITPNFSQEIVQTPAKMFFLPDGVSDEKYLEEVWKIWKGKKTLFPT